MVRPLSKDEKELWQLLEQTEGGPEAWLWNVHLLTPTFMQPDHLLPVADLFHRAETVGGVRACISVPPRHGKTELVLSAIVRWLYRHPEQTVGYVSYAADFAHSRSHRARELAQHMGIRLAKSQRAVQEWRTEQGGGMLAVGVGGPLTGHGVNLLVVDDPTKNREEAESPLVRQKIHEWFTSTALTRIMPGGSALVVHTRWHADDLIGRLIVDKDAPWEYVNLPVTALDQDPLGRPPGQFLWPQFWTPAEMDLRRREVGIYDWASMYMGNPTPRGRAVFKEPARYKFPDVQGARIVIGCDPAATEKTSADHSVIVVLSMKEYGTLQTADVLDVWRGQVEIPRLVRELVAMQKKWRAPVVVEQVGGFKAVGQMLRHVDPNIRILPTELQTADKFTRAMASAAAWNDGRLRVPMEAEWLDDFLLEVQRFTGKKDKQDDQVDALSHAFNAASRLIAPGRTGVVSIPGA